MSCKLSKIQYIIDRLVKSKASPEQVGISLENAIKARDMLIYASQVDAGVIAAGENVNAVVANKMLIEIDADYQDAKSRYDAAKAITDKLFTSAKEFMVKADGSIKLGLRAKDSTAQYMEILKEDIEVMEMQHSSLSASYTAHMNNNTLDSQRAKYAKEELAKVSKELTKAKERLTDTKAKHKTAATNTTKRSNAFTKAEESVEDTLKFKKVMDRAAADVQLSGPILNNKITNVQSGAKGVTLGTYFSGKTVGNVLPRMKELLATSYQNAVELLQLSPATSIHAQDSIPLMISTENNIRASVKNMLHDKVLTIDVKNSSAEGYQNLIQLLMVEVKDDNGKVVDRALPPSVVTAMAASLNDWLYTTATTPKDKEWVNRFLGNTPKAPVTPEMWEQVDGVDTTISNAAQSIGGAVVKALGIKADTEKNVLSKDLLDKLAVEIGLVAIQSAHSNKGVKPLRIMKKDSSQLYGEGKGQQVNGKDIQVTVIGIHDNYKELVKSPEHKKAVDGANKVLQIDSKVKKPRTAKNHEDKVFKNKSKQSTWFTTADKTQEALNKHENVEWTFNESYMADIINELESDDLVRLKAHLGWQDLENVHVNYVKGVEGRNRAIEKELADLIDVYNEAKANGTEGIFFNYFFGKNGRFYVDSNTLNPQGYKSQRGAIVNNVKVIETDTEVDAQNLAFAQAFGVDIDKLTIEESLKEWGTIQKSLDTIDFNEHSMSDILDMLNDNTLKGGTATWHNMMGIANYRDYQKHFRKHGTIKGMEARLVAEIDGVTNGYIIKTLQMPLHDDYEVHLQSGGVFVGERVDKAPDNIGDGEFVKDAKGEGGVYFKYKSFGKQAMSKDTTDNYEKPANVMAKLVPEVLESFGDNELIKRTTEIAMNGALGSADNGKLPAVARSYMKEPFMVFNYGAGMATILNTLIYGSVAKGAMDRFYDLVVDNSTESRNQVIAIIRASANGMYKNTDGVWEVNKGATISSAEVEALVNKYETLGDKQNLSFILPKNFEANLASGVKAGLGQSLEKAFEPYAPYIDAGDSINRSFQAMFRLFQAKLDDRLAAAQEVLGRQVITEEEVDYIIDSMVDSMPAIKTALGEGMRDKLLIYKEASNTVDATNGKVGELSARGKFKYKETKAGTKPVLYAKTKKRKLIESFASGGVIPIHFLDGSLMSLTLAETDSLGIHDALLVVAGELESTAKEYNKAVALLTKEYSFTTEVLKSFRDVINNATDAEIQVVDATYNNEAKEAQDDVAHSTRSIYAAMERTQKKSESKRVEMLSRPIRYEQMAFEGGHYDWNMEGAAYEARTVDRPNKREQLIENHQSAGNTKPAIIADNKLFSESDLAASQAIIDKAAKECKS